MSRKFSCGCSSWRGVLGDGQQLLRQSAHEPRPIRQADEGRHDDKIDHAQHQTIRLILGVALAISGAVAEGLAGLNICVPVL